MMKILHLIWMWNKQQRQPSIRNDADGHLIYHTGDILQNRCSWILWFYKKKMIKFFFLLHLSFFLFNFFSDFINFRKLFYWFNIFLKSFLSGELIRWARVWQLNFQFKRDSIFKILINVAFWTCETWVIDSDKIF